MPDWDAILREVGPAVWRSARRLLGNDADADECLQEAFVAGVELSRRQTVKYWRAYLTKVAVGRAIDRLRQKKRRGDSLELSEWENVDPSSRLPSEQAEAAELAQRLRTALTELPAKQSEIFSLTCLEGWSYAEVAEHLAVSVDHVGVAVHRARSKLRELLASKSEVRK